MTEQPDGVLNPRVKDLEIEMAYTTWAESCQDPHICRDNSLRQCRRRKNHDGAHASGFASTRTLMVWT